MNEIDVALLCKALGDPNRLKIVQMLSDGEKCGCKLLEARRAADTLPPHEDTMRMWAGKARKEEMEPLFIELRNAGVFQGVHRQPVLL